VRLRKLWPAAAVAVATAAPVGIALAAETPAPGPSIVSPALTTSLAGDATAGEAMREAGVGRHVSEHVRLGRRYADLTGRPVNRPALLRRAQNLTPRALRAANRELRGEVEELDIPIPPVLKQVAECESHGDPKAIGGGGSFRGRYQMMVSTWQSVGGEGDPAAAPAEEQDRRAALLLQRSGASPWPVCGA
jgi:Transglycosylase-like domain